MITAIIAIIITGLLIIINKTLRRYRVDSQQIAPLHFRSRYFPQIKRIIHKRALLK